MTRLFTLAERLSVALKTAGLHLVTAESCTGGGIAAAATAVPGSSAWFDRGVVVYSNTAKQEMLGVAPALIETHGAVSEPVVVAMADGVRAGRGDRAAIAISGIAGPEGGSPTKPVGTVCLGLAIGRDPARARTVHLTGDRAEIRQQAVYTALADLIDAVQSR